MLKELEQIGPAEALKDYHCKAASLTTDSHSILTIRIHYPELKGSVWYLNFSGVYYFEGPVFWTGADFAGASDEISFDTWKSVYPEQSTERIKQITEIFPVCTVQTASKLIVIAYGGLSVSKSDR